jgi:hypothetical protein
LYRWIANIRKQAAQYVEATMAFGKTHVLGLRGSSSQGSDPRRMTMRFCTYWTMVYFTWALFTTQSPLPEQSIFVSFSVIVPPIVSLIIFVQIILLMPFRDRVGNDFELDARRLVYDTMISSAFMIVVFAALYKNTGLMFGTEEVKPSALDAIYFSSVTFSTLGYGDFAPHPSLRIVAAIQALLGNLHLGMVVGATFSAIKR